MPDETSLSAWPRLTRSGGDVFTWADQLVDRLRYFDNWMVVGRTLKPRNPNWEVEGGGAQGPAGPTGPMGPQGSPGLGVPAGGTTGEHLAKKTNSDYDTIWVKGGGATVNVGPVPPVGPSIGDLWWRNDPDGTLFVFYNDGNSSQWVPATPTIKGDPGPPGGGPVAYRHVQSVANTVWIIPHNLTFRPNVTTVDSSGREVIPGAIDYTDAVTVQLTFSAAVGGEAYLS